MPPFMCAVVHANYHSDRGTTFSPGFFNEQELFQYMHRHGKQYVKTLEDDLKLTPHVHYAGVQL